MMKISFAFTVLLCTSSFCLAKLHVTRDVADGAVMPPSAHGRGARRKIELQGFGRPSMDVRRRVRKQISRSVQSVVDDDEMGGDVATDEMGGKKFAKGKQGRPVSREPKKAGKGKKGLITDDDVDASAVVEMERTSSPEAATEAPHGAENSPTTAPSPILDVQPTPSPAGGYNTLTPSATDNEIVSCGRHVPEIDTKVDVSYVYNIVISDSVDIDSMVNFVEIQTLDAVASEFVVCEGDRRRLSTLVAVSPLPKDLPSGSCGAGCTSVTGGMTLYVNNEGNTDAIYLQCQVVTVVRQTMLQLESSSYNGIIDIEFVDTDDIDCEGTATDTSGGGSLQGIHGVESQATSQGEHEVSNGGLVGIALGSTFIAVLALAIVRRYRRGDDGMAYVSTVDDKDDDLCSVVTPDTACDSRQSPHKTSPDRGGTFASLPSTPERGMITDADGSPIAQFDPDLLDASNATSKSVVAANKSAEPTKLFAVGTPFFARLRNLASGDGDESNRKSGRGSEDFTHDGVADECAAVLGDELSSAGPVEGKSDAKHASPMLAIWQNSSSKDLDGSGRGGSNFLTAIPEGEDEGDDHSVATAEISNVSPPNRSPIRAEAGSADCDVTFQGVYV